MINIVALLVTLLCSLALAQHDPSVCKPYPNSRRSMPTLPKGYSVLTELNIISENETVEVREYYDASLNMSAYEQVAADEEIYAIMNFNTNQYIYIEPAIEGMAKECQVTDLSKFVPSFDQATKKSSIIRLMDAYKLVHDSPSLYNGSGILRGESVQVWKTCVYLEAWKSTFDVTWYFSLDGWITASGTAAVPVRMHLVGKTTDDKGKVSTHERIYDFSEYAPIAPDSKVFELHSGSYCKGIKQKKALPGTPSYFSYGIEYVSFGGATGNIRSDQYIYYNKDIKLFRMDYVESNKGARGYNKGPLTQIHDFHTGVAYLIYKNRGTCDITLIEKGRQDVTSVDSTHVRMATSKKFFGLDRKDFVYEGRRNVRGIDCDIWIDTRTDWPTNNSAESLWEWAFSANEVFTDNSRGKTEMAFPVQLEINQPKTETHVLHNIYGVKDDYQDYELFDTTMCYNDNQRFNYEFAMHGTYKQIVQNRELAFKNNVRLTLSIYAGISPLRITNIKIDYDSEDVVVSFTILDIPIVTDDVRPAFKGNNLQDATTRLYSGILARGLSIDVGNGHTVPLKDATYKRIISIPAPKLGKYKPGDMAGIGLGMLIVGVLAGGLLTNFILKKRLGDKFKAVRFGSQMDQNETSVDNNL